MENAGNAVAILGFIFFAALIITSTNDTTPREKVRAWMKRVCN